MEGGTLSKVTQPFFNPVWPIVLPAPFLVTFVGDIMDEKDAVCNCAAENKAGRGSISASQKYMHKHKVLMNAQGPQCDWCR